MTLLAYLLLGLAVILAVLVLGMALTQPAGAQETTGTASTYQEAYKPWAVHWQQQATQVRRNMARMTMYPGRLPKVPQPQQYQAIQIDVTTGTEVVVVQWRDYGRKCKALATGWRRLREHLTNPGGSGAARWWPLASYVGWPASERANWIYCVTWESHGNPWDGPCVSIMQIHPVHAAKFRQVTGVSLWSSRVKVWASIMFGLFLWRGSGWSPWVVM